MNIPKLARRTGAERVLRSVACERLKTETFIKLARGRKDSITLEFSEEASVDDVPHVDALSGDIEEAESPAVVQRERHDGMILLDDLVIYQIVEVVTKGEREDAGIT